MDLVIIKYERNMKEICRNATSISVGAYINLLSLIDRRRKAIIDMMPASKIYDELDFLFV